MESKTTRYYYIDNIKAVLIALVVFGHLLETVSFAGKDYIYNVIYSFHMPAFAFMSGMLYKRKSGARRLGRYILIYVVFQFLYMLFNAYVLDTPTTVQFTTPYWILWYLVAMIFWTIAADYLDFTVKSGLAVIAVSVALALVIGYETSFGYYMSLSRTVSFFPFYISGAYISKFRDRFASALKEISGAAWKILSLVGVILCLCGIWIKRKEINCTWLYNSYSYDNAGYNAGIRLIFFIVAAVFIFFLLSFACNKKIFLISTIGKNSLPVFLLHGFAVKYLSHIQWAKYITHPLLVCSVITVMMLLLLSSKPVSFVFKHIFR